MIPCKDLISGFLRVDVVNIDWSSWSTRQGALTIRISTGPTAAQIPRGNTTSDLNHVESRMSIVDGFGWYEQTIWRNLRDK